MNHWPFIVGAYAVALVGALGLTAQSWLAMRRAEAEAERLKK
ncbi:MAG TPA: heme exporter protein CcmD [Allosphingosinicella sp.]